MTSNLGSSVFQDEGLSADKRREEILDDVRGYFRPEFINRIDEIVVFEPLDRDQLRDIVHIQLGALRRRLSERGIALETTDGAIDRLADRGYDAAFGARPLKRLIQREIGDPLAMKLLAGEVRDGTTVKVDVVDGDLVISGS
jgi:ATP-dependent Clp protease ATP-binding subunit ClpB